MLRVTIEVVPYGIDEQTQVLDTIYIGNSGGNHSVAHYDVYDQDPRGQPYPRWKRQGWVGRLKWISRRGDDHGRFKVAALALALVNAKRKAM